MRPAKRILLAGNDEDRVGELRFVLRTHLFRVTIASSYAEAAELLDAPLDLLLIILPLERARELVNRLRESAPHIAALVVEPDHYAPPRWAPVVALCKGQCSSAAILERVKLLTARKRGPRLGSHRQPPIGPLLKADSEIEKEKP